MYGSANGLSVYTISNVLGNWNLSLYYSFGSVYYSQVFRGCCGSGERDGGNSFLKIAANSLWLNLPFGHSDRNARCQLLRSCSVNCVL